MYFHPYNNSYYSHSLPRGHRYISTMNFGPNDYSWQRQIPQRRTYGGGDSTTQRSATVHFINGFTPNSNWHYAASSSKNQFSPAPSTHARSWDHHATPTPAHQAIAFDPSVFFAGLTDVLDLVFGAPGNIQQRPTTTYLRPEPANEASVGETPHSVSSLKDELEAHLYQNEDTEMQDVARAILASLADEQPVQAQTDSSFEPVPFAAYKGKGKAVVDAADESVVIPTPGRLAASRDAIRDVEATYQALVDDFVYPQSLDFLDTASIEQAPLLRLSYTARNAPVRYHHEALQGFLARLDGIQSFGDEELRSWRKALVGIVEQAMDEVEALVDGRWKAKVAKEAKERKEQEQGATQDPEAPTADVKPPEAASVGDYDSEDELAEVWNAVTRDGEDSEVEAAAEEGESDGDSDSFLLSEAHAASGKELAFKKPTFEDDEDWLAV
ncbi:hypothetical protein CYLTODRAFT_490580 [Cylindrobasidium torrendii FP15055 ss-10]|uniref:Uncharacterized protein n=1 Tax=Cylindrobasidium torrendii FP15055 ss-10 TaxID=1314674 RepID=A0A0D7BBG8_9AGAR|nr:hypothetical protein CYLTODRAFT_490580 [Cylindrobasidium torrendii FP15055 ss-10]